ncbi:MAG TPA: tetratricopeptide repeat protein, partial [Steroidobacter sp.]|nr:tetratricopeptide repeat protein [Steroidobacter sp.]
MSAMSRVTLDARQDIEEFLEKGFEILDTRPAAALERASRTLAIAPDHVAAHLLSAMAHRLLGNFQVASGILTRLAEAQPDAGIVHYERGLALAAEGKSVAAIAALRRAMQLSPGLPGGWRTLADHLRAVGDSQAADAAYANHIKASTRNPRLMQAAAALCGNDISTAEALLRPYLQQHPTDVAAIRMLAEVAARIGRFAEAGQLLERCLELAPGFVEARAQYASVLCRLNRPLDALQEIEGLLATQPRNPNLRNLKATTLVSIGEYEQSRTIYADLLDEYPDQAKLWLNYGHVLKTAGHRQEAIRAYRRCLALSPSLGEAWFTLANLKTFRFTATDVETMRAALSAPGISAGDRVHLNFALGKACEDEGQFESSFEYYKTGNQLRRVQIDYDAQDTTSLVQRSRALFSKEFFEQRVGVGAAAPDPIFVVGLPRSGSTLVDQILCSHSMIEGTMELH